MLVVPPLVGARATGVQGVRGACVRVGVSCVWVCVGVRGLTWWVGGPFYPEGSISPGFELVDLSIGAEARTN